MTMTDYQARCIVLAAGIITFGMIVVAWIEDDPYVLHTFGPQRTPVVLNKETGDFCLIGKCYRLDIFEEYEPPPPPKGLFEGLTPDPQPPSKGLLEGFTPSPQQSDPFAELFERQQGPSQRNPFLEIPPETPGANEGSQ